MSIGRRHLRAFSMVELIIVVAIIGVISAIAVPRVTRAAARSRVASVKADLRTVTEAIFRYSAEHPGRSPAHDKNGLIDTSGTDFSRRLTQNTTEFGDSGAGAIFGPYLASIPTNPFNDLATVRIDGPAAGAGTHGWRFDTTTWEFLADDSPATALIRVGRIEGAFVEDGKLVGGTDADGKLLKP